MAVADVAAAGRLADPLHRTRFAAEQQFVFRKIPSFLGRRHQRKAALAETTSSGEPRNHRLADRMARDLRRQPVAAAGVRINIRLRKKAAELLEYPLAATHGHQPVMQQRRLLSIFPIHCYPARFPVIEMIHANSHSLYMKRRRFTNNPKRKAGEFTGRSRDFRRICRNGKKKTKKIICTVDISMVLFP